MADKKKLQASPLFWGIIGLILGTFFPYLVLLKSDVNQDVAGILSILFGCVAFLSCYTLPSIMEFKSEINSRINDLSQHAAIGMPEERFKGWLDCISDHNGSRQWIIAKYISQKLNMDFPNEKGTSLSFIDKEGRRVSDLIGNLIRETKKTYLFSFPYKPKEWFEILYPEICKCCDMSTCSLGSKEMKLRFTWPPPHIQALSRSRIKKKIRLVTEQWDLDPKEEKCKKKLLDVSKGAKIHTKYISSGVNGELGELVKEINKDKLDINILDGLVIVWNKREGKFDLILSKKDTDRYTDLFKDILLLPTRSGT